MKANDSLKDYYCTENYYHYICGTVLTDGAKALADRFECYWFLDVIASYQKDKRLARTEGFQVWRLKKNADGSADVICENGNKRVLITQHFEATSFEPDEAIVWVEGNVMLLPSEH